MANESMFRGIIDFFIKMGVYDVILPFLLVFTIVFAILEKTKVLGTIDGKKSNKNLNSMTAFVIAFMVIASARLVEIITMVSSQFVILLLLSVLFLILIGSFYPSSKEVALEGGLFWLFITIMLVGIILIFLNAIKNDAGVSWLQIAMDFMRQNWSSTAVGSIILIAIMVGFVYWIVNGDETKPAKPP